MYYIERRMYYVGNPMFYAGEPETACRTKKRDVAAPENDKNRPKNYNFLYFSVFYPP